MSSEKDRSRPTFPVAIVGMSCRLPGANDLEEFWTLLRSGTDAVGEIPKDRWDVDYYYHPDPGQPGRTYVRAGGFLRDIDKFDADFFGVSPREARQMDPQQRILLELTWEALENADIVPGKIAGSDAGVFIGISQEDYGILQRNAGEGIVDPYGASGSALSIAANRISYLFDLHGPSLAIDTACSSALVAVHQACESLRQGETSLAIAGGVNILLLPETFVAFSKAAMLSIKGRCSAFDADADGYVRSEGGGVVILKPLAAALADGNPVHAVIMGSAVNSDGRTKGIALPNPVAQEKLLRSVYTSAGIDPARIDFVEAHGTGTNAGDRVECMALGRVFGAARSAGDPCRIGSVKTNIGHLEPASGIAGLLKAALALKHREIPPSLHFHRPNPKIPFEDLNLAVVTELTPLPATGDGGEVMSAINSFGFGGTNAHVVLRSHQAQPEAASKYGQPGAVAPMFLSARSPNALKAMAQSYARLLRAPAAPPLREICRAAAVHRSHHAHRIALLGASAQDVAARLDAYAADQPVLMLVEGEARYQTSRLALVFSGNGSQWLGMGRDLFTREPVFADCVRKIDGIVKELAGWSLLDMMNRDHPTDLYDKTELAQPALFAVQVGVAAVLRARGVVAEAVLGHSVGEVAAACCAGILSLEQACLIVTRRSEAQSRTAGAGRMAAVGLSESQAKEAIAAYGDALSIAGINSPVSVTLAGDAAALEALGTTLKARGVFFRLLAVDYAFHSRVMEPLRDEVLREFAAVSPTSGGCRFFSTVTGGESDGTALDANYWWDNIRKPVQFARAVQRVAAEGIDVFLEIGPHPLLAGYLRECLQGRLNGTTVIGTLRRDESECDALWMTIARCYAAGVEVDWSRLFAGPVPPVPLPAYPWQRERYWFTKNDRMSLPRYGVRVHPLLGYRVPVAETAWKNLLDPAKLEYLADHVVQGVMVFPAACIIEMALAAAAARLQADSVEIVGLDIRRPIVFSGKSGLWVEFGLASDENSFQLLTQEKPDVSQPPVAVGRVAALAADIPIREIALDTLREGLPCRIDRDDHYARCAAHGLTYGPAFRGLAEAWMREGEVLARIETPAMLNVGGDDYLIHPAVLDACLQSVVAALPATAPQEPQAAVFLPTQLDRFRFFGVRKPVSWCRARVRQADRRSIVASFALFDEAGTPIAEIDDLRFRRMRSPQSSEISAWHWLAQLQPGRAAAASAADLPGPKSIVSALAKEVQDLRHDAGYVRFRRDAGPALDRLAGLYVRRTLERLGAGGGPFGLADLAERAGTTPDRAHGLRALLSMAEDEGHLRRAGDSWTLVPAVGEDPDTLWRRLVAAEPACLASLEAVARCGDHLLELLRGEADIVQLMFPERDFSAGEQLLDADPALGIGNEMAACVMRHLRDATPRDRALRILEIGGATGGLASAVLSTLPAERAAYFFTDAFESAVARAQGRFANFPFVHYAVFDVEHDVTEPGLEAGSFDVVVAAHALGGAATPSESLERLRRLLKPGGLLLLVEKRPAGFLDFILGPWRRRSSPSTEPAPSLALAPPRWTTLLDAAGFGEIAVLGDDDAAATTVSILARNPEAKPSPQPTPIEAVGNWIVLGGGKAHVPKSAIATRLALAGQRVLTVMEGDVFARLDDTTLQAPLDDPDDYRRLVAALKAHAATGMDIVYARSLTRLTNGAARDPMTAQDHGSLGLLLLAQALIDGGLAGPARLWVVTGGAMSVPGRPGPLDPVQAPLWGVARTLMNERPDFNIRLIDVDPRADDAVDALVAELLHPTGEDEIVLQGAARYVQRLRRGMPAAMPRPRSPAYRLVLRAHEDNDGLALEANPVPHPDGDEIVVRVRAAGLNYRDVLQRVGVLPEEAFEGGFAGATLGMEFAGEVVGVGPDASGLKIGDGVYGFAPSAFSSHVKVTSSAVFRMPPAMTFAEAATLPVATLTAYYALHHVARLQRGETVLIHGAAGGVGLAAIQYAQHVGAHVFASAGTPAKREFLRRLGVRHVVDSRSLSFADEIRRLTDGQGIDVVLNSLAGEALRKGVSLLRAYGRFIELGKRDFWANTKLGLQPFRNNIQFSGVDVDRLLADRPALAQQLLRDLDGLIARRVLHPLPHRVFSVTRAADAFRHMQQSRHIGKVVLAFPEDVEVSPSGPSGHLKLSDDATYLVTGGRNGFGLATAEWLVAKGARHLVLVGRSQETQPAAAAVLRSLRGLGVVVHEAVADVADADQLAQLLAFIRRKMPPLKGIFHCAAVIEDAAVATMSPDRFRGVLRPKVAGATNLDQLTRDMPLDFFVLYSSAVTLFGNPGQSNYVAANLYLEALAAQRRAAGLPALAVLWGAIEGVGHLARNAEIAKAMSERLGVRLLPPKRALERLEQAMVGDVGQVAIAEFSWSRLMHSPRLAQSPKYALVRPAPDEPALEGEREGGDLAEKLASMPEAQRYPYVQQLVINHLAAVLRVPTKRLDLNQSLLDLGMDSLMVVELQLAMEQQFGIAISPMELMDVATVGELARRIAEKLGLEPRNAAAEEAPPADPEDIDMLPPEMLDVVLGKLLEQDDDAARTERVS